MFVSLHRSTVSGREQYLVEARDGGGDSSICSDDGDAEDGWSWVSIIRISCCPEFNGIGLLVDLALDAVESSPVISYWSRGGGSNTNQKF